MVSEMLALGIIWPSMSPYVTGVLSLMGYYCRFVQGYGTITKPLTDLTRKNAFEWNDRAMEAFQKHKALMGTLPTLVIPDSSKEFVIETNAATKGWRAVLSQQGCPIGFLSQALSPGAC
ncbi:uncharacterized mitochondrial protein AtMg00860-like [Arachis hypogaea]|uniref:uncharacterized mitochondrial protein AtMg00860-like n=1 Tax=Arachis hypogaea TaxID=3818 RepID=UPI003B224B09